MSDTYVFIAREKDSRLYDACVENEGHADAVSFFVQADSKDEAEFALVMFLYDVPEELADEPEVHQEAREWYRRQQIRLAWHANFKAYMRDVRGQ